MPGNSQKLYLKEKSMVKVLKRDSVAKYNKASNVIDLGVVIFVMYLLV